MLIYLRQLFWKLLVFVIADFRELRTSLKFFFKFEKTDKEAIKMLSIPYNDGYLEKNQFSRGFSVLKVDRCQFMTNLALDVL